MCTVVLESFQHPRLPRYLGVADDEEVEALALRQRVVDLCLRVHRRQARVAVMLHRRELLPELVLEFGRAEADLQARTVTRGSRGKAP